MSKFWYGTLRKTATGAVQFVRNEDKKKDFLLITGQHGDLLIPVDSVYKALEDHWVADSFESRSRKTK